MGCGSSNFIGLTPSQLSTLQREYRNQNDPRRKITGVYTIHSGQTKHVLSLTTSGQIIIDGTFALSVVYKNDNTEFTFKMPEGGSLVSGTVRFTDASTVNGVFLTQDSHCNRNTYVIQGEIDTKQSTDKVAMKGSETIVIDKTTLKRFKEIESKLEVYQNRELYPNICNMIDKAKAQEENLQKAIKEIDDLKETIRKAEETHGEHSDEVKTLHHELEDKCMSLAFEQKSYEQTLKYIRNSTGDLFDYNILSQEFDDLLNVMFGGDAGSDMENMLEQQLIDLEEAKKTLETSHEREQRLWKDAKHLCGQALEAINTWSTLGNDNVNSDKDKLYLTKKTRSLLTLLIDGIIDIEVELTKEEGYVAKDQGRQQYIYLRNNIYEMYSDKDKVNEGTEALSVGRTTVQEIEKWIYEKYRLEEYNENVQTKKNEILQAKLKLKTERRGLIQQWFKENVGSDIEDGELDTKKDENIDTSKPDPVHPHENTNNTDDENASIETAEDYEQLIARVREQKHRENLAEVRSNMEFQEKLRARRERQRHKNKQKMLEAS